MIAQESKKFLNPANRTISTTFILPMLFDNKDFLYNKYGFINVFIEDINKPWLDNHIFILYNSSGIPTVLEKEFKANKYYYDTKHIVIDNVFYNEYIFTIPPEYKYIIKSFKGTCHNNLITEDKIKILKFWGLSDLKHIKNLLEEDISDCSLVERGEIIPEEDYLESYNEQNSKYFLQKLGFEV